MQRVNMAHFVVNRCHIPRSGVRRDLLSPRMWLLEHIRGDAIMSICTISGAVLSHDGLLGNVDTPSPMLPLFHRDWHRASMLWLRLGVLVCQFSVPLIVMGLYRTIPAQWHGLAAPTRRHVRCNRSIVHYGLSMRSLS